MNISDEWNRLRQQEHTSSFENLGSWLNEHQPKPKKMKTIYKVAASIVLTASVLVACSIPVEQEEEIGYMIKGISESGANTLRNSLSALPQKELSQISINQVLIDNIEKDGDKEEVYLTEMVMVLAEADYEAAVEKRDRIAALAPYQKLEILPIEEKIKMPFYEKALSTVDIKLVREIPDSVIVERVDEFLKEHSSVSGNAKVSTDSDGQRVVEIIVEELDTSSSLEIKHPYQNGISPRISISKLDSLSLKEIKERQVEQVKEVKVIRQNN
ncbi:MAG: hypothetical protein AAFW89_06475 [Bacteroidota bacterium]